MKQRACSASISAGSTCSSGSPPVSTTKRCDGVSPQCLAISSASSSAVLNLPPPSPSVPTKSVSQNLQTASARSSRGPSQVAAGEAAEHRRPARVGPFALQRVEDFLDAIHGAPRSLALAAPRGEAPRAARKGGFAAPSRLRPTCERRRREEGRTMVSRRAGGSRAARTPPALPAGRPRPARPGRTAGGRSRRSADRPPASWTSACSGFTSRMGLVSGAVWPDCLSRRARCALISPSSTTMQAAESTRRDVARTSLARSFSASFRRSSTGANAVAACSAAFFSSSSCSEPRSTAPLATLCSEWPSNSCRCDSSHSSTRSTSSSTSMPFLRKISSCGLALAAPSESEAIT